MACAFNSHSGRQQIESPVIHWGLFAKHDILDWWILMQLELLDECHVHVLYVCCIVTPSFWVS